MLNLFSNNSEFLDISNQICLSLVQNPILASKYEFNEESLKRKPSYSM